ncbi:alpha/beta fold hydrolase [Marinobacter psychrophilus]|uniref:alpha/beta fold hydrolase n=1 Tax=Marinobacter psychrophilus TaxID=330734 RepID=UPI001B6DD56E|nr:alpha/beta fold hydrolase [Marinobacter psychrophilus]MBQ0764311.1 alpha/beta fold hydrolase [Marinobacter psychrophilus]MBQ0845091.1 alpha/beta fold hydrolase [Marinobacter psychrophilus]
MLQKSPCTVFFLLLSIVLLSACSRQDIYQKAIGFERSTAGLEAASITLGELDIAYLRNADMNSGDTIVMVHGFGANKDNWTRMARELANKFNVYAIDLPGHGESSKPLDLGYRLDQQVAHLARILQALDIAEMHMMGNSMGGAITALYAATYPEQIKTAVLFDPAGILEYESELFDLVVAGDNPLIPSKPGDFKRLMDFALEKKPFIPWPVLGVMEDQALANQTVNEVIFTAIRDADLEPDFRTVIARIKAPVLVVWGKEDRVIDYRNGEVFVDIIPGARLEVLDGVGHVPMIEAPEESARLFLEFAKSHAPKAG